MQVYLPIAEVSVNALALLGLGGAVGFLSGLFGVGGGFLMTPLLIVIGIPPAVAVGTQANQLVAASVSGVLAHWRRRNVDIKVGVVMLAGGLLGTLLGVWLFGVLQRLGQIDFVISISYVVLLGSIGLLMLLESGRTWWRGRSPKPLSRTKPGSGWRHELPLKMHFPQSNLYISALLPLTIGLVGGVMVAVLGVGGGFLLVPAMIYLLGMPTAMVSGTSLFQIIFTTAIATLLQSLTNHTVDILLAALLIVGGVIGAQFGTRVAGHLRGEVVRLLLAAMVVSVAGKLAYDLIAPPADLYSILVLPPSTVVDSP